MEDNKKKLVYSDKQKDVYKRMQKGFGGVSGSADEDDKPQKSIDERASDMLQRWMGLRKPGSEKK